jgi:hypothetical protein
VWPAFTLADKVSPRPFRSCGSSLGDATMSSFLAAGRARRRARPRHGTPISVVRK